MATELKKMQATKEDIQRNRERVLNDEPLDMPLSVLGSKLKDSIMNFLYRRTENYREKQKVYYQKNRVRILKQIKERGLKK